MTETAVQIGRDKHLSGVVSLPPSGGAPATGVVLMNAGVIHRIGPHRFNVKLARRLAHQGFPVIRIDLTGLGDSAVPSNALPYETQSVADLQAAMDSLSALTGATSFLLAGICSGARNAWATALADERVRGIWMLDGHFLPTKKTPLHFWSRKVAHEGLWPLSRRLALRMVRQLRSRAGATAADPPPVPWDSAQARRRFLDELSRLVGRGVHPCFAYSGSNLRDYSYDNQLEDVFRGKVPAGSVTVHFMPEVDHTLTTLGGQATVAAQIEAFCMSLTENAATRPDR